MSGMSAVDAALRRYPTWWQDRYGTEVRSLTADLAAEGRSPRRLAVDLVRGAIRVRAQAEGMPKRFGLWATRTRLSIALATLPWMVAVPLVLIAMGSQRLHATGGMVVHSGITPAGSHLHLLPTGGAFIPAHGTFPPSAPPLTMAGSMAAYAAFAMIPLLIITLVVLATGWGRLIGAIRTSCSPQRAKVTVLAWTPGFALLADIGLIAAQIAVRPSRFGGGMNGRPIIPLNGDPAAAHALGILLAVVAIAGWLVSVACIAAVAAHADVAAADLRFGRTVAVIVTALFTMLAGAYATWGIGLILQARQAARGRFTVITYSNHALWLPTIVVVVALVALSVAGTRAATKSWKVIALELI